MKPSVTVITPAYNCERYIEETINSVLLQSYSNINYVVINDGSTDGTGRILDKYNRCLKVINQENGGENRAVNQGLLEVQRLGSKYFMIVNADDPLLLHCVEALVSIMETCPRILCAYPDWQMIDEDGHTIRHMKGKDYDFKFMVRHHWNLPSVGSIFRSEVIDRVGFRDCQFKYIGDFDYWLRVGLEGPMLHFPMQLATWRKSNTQLTSEKNDTRHAERSILMDKFYSLPNIPGEIMEVKKEAYSWMSLVAAIESTTVLQRIKYILKAMCYHPRQLITLDFWYSLSRYATYYIRRKS